LSEPPDMWLQQRLGVESFMLATALLN
jgi:hypothetical protein